MTDLMRWKPFAEMEELQSRLSSWLDVAPGTSGSDGVAWAPPLDVLESRDEYVVRVDLPEVQKGDLEVTLENGVLTISGERKQPGNRDMKYLVAERGYGKFSRSIELPKDADPNQIKASFRNGLLTVRVGKAEQAKPRLIPIQDK